MFRHIKKYVKDSKWILVIGILSIIFTDVMQTFVPYVLGKGIDILSGDKQIPYSIYDIIAVLLFMQLFIAITRYAFHYFLGKAVVRIEYSLRTDYFKKLESLDNNFYIENKTGDLMARATNDINSITALFRDGVITFVDSVFMTVFIIVFMFMTIDVKITLLSISPMLLIGIFMAIGSPMLQKRMFARNEHFGKVSEKAREFFSGIRVIKSYAKEPEIESLFDRENKILYHKNMSVVRVFGVMEPMIRSISLLTVTLSIYIGGSAVFDGVISLGTFVALLDYIRKLVWPFMAIGFLVATIQSGLASIRRINYIFDATSDIRDRDISSSPSVLTGNISIKKLSFSHEAKIIPTLKHVNISIKSGETVGIIGKTGSGKTTLVNLLLRLENPPRNTIFYDGVDINDIKIEMLRKSISYSMQNSVIFSDSIIENITLKKDCSEKDIYDFTKLARLHNEIMSFKDDYNTAVGEKGVTLSGGQKQRLDISRALYKNAPIMIFDDSLSAVDNKTQGKIISDLKTKLKGKTTIIISHRISTIEHADKIVVMNNGFIDDIGSHAELISKGGLYSELYKLQSIEDEILEYEE